MGYAFISYSTKNQTSADTIRELFNRNGIETWMAPYDIPAGSKYARVITGAIRDCSCFVLLLTNDSQASDAVDSEVELAVLHFKKTVITIQLEDVALNDSFTFYIHNKQIIPVTVINDNDINMKKVLTSVKSCTGQTFSFDKKAEMSAEEMYRKGNRYYSEKNYEEAVKWYQKAADQGHTDSQYNLGNCYLWGDGVVQDDAAAFKWYRKSAEQGNAKAQYSLGYCYCDGNGVKKDYAEAIKWYQKSAEQGNLKAQVLLFYCYYLGKYVKKDYREAVKWGQVAAEQGDADVQYLLGACYENGQGVTKDYAEAVKWYQKAAEQGYADAQCKLGYCYEYGYGVQKDITEAKKWYQKAADQGDKKAQRYLKYLN